MYYLRRDDRWQEVLWLAISRCQQQINVFVQICKSCDTMSSCTVCYKVKIAEARRNCLRIVLNMAAKSAPPYRVKLNSADNKLKNDSFWVLIGEEFGRPCHWLIAHIKPGLIDGGREWWLLCKEYKVSSHAIKMSWVTEIEASLDVQ